MGQYTTCISATASISDLQNIVLYNILQALRCCA